ncbi:MAG: nucleotidyltransferase family protein [Parabacteroides sp.]|nr:nucleotidyltransferase family protein [Parabacteroides sp.]
MKTTQEIINLLRDFKMKQAAKYGILKMGVFGSVARGEQNEDSDVDVYIEGDIKGLFALAGIKNDLEDLLGCRVDIVRLRDRMDTFLRKRIQKEGVYV